MTSSVIKVYSARMCGFCRAAERLLKSKGVTYEVIKVDEDPALYEHMKQISGRHTVPQIFIGDHHGATVKIRQYQADAIADHAGEGEIHLLTEAVMMQDHRKQ